MGEPTPNVSFMKASRRSNASESSLPSTDRGQLVAASKAVLQANGGSKRTNLAPRHDGDRVTQDIRLFHTVRGQHDDSVLLGRLDGVPDVAFWRWGP